MSTREFSKLSLYAAVTAVAFVAAINAVSTLNGRNSDIFISGYSATR